MLDFVMHYLNLIQNKHSFVNVVLGQMNIKWDETNADFAIATYLIDLSFNS